MVREKPKRKVVYLEPIFRSNRELRDRLKKTRAKLKKVKPHIFDKRWEFPLCSGEMTKEGSGNLKAWKKRYFLLTAAGKLYFFKNSSKPNPLKKPFIIKDARYRHDQEKGKKLCIEVDCKSHKKPLFFYAENQAEYNKWMTNLFEAGAIYHYDFFGSNPELWTDFSFPYTFIRMFDAIKEKSRHIKKTKGLNVFFTERKLANHSKYDVERSEQREMRYEQMKKKMIDGTVDTQFYRKKHVHALCYTLTNFSRTVPEAILSQIYDKLIDSVQLVQQDIHPDDRYEKKKKKKPSKKFSIQEKKVVNLLEENLKYDYPLKFGFCREFFSLLHEVGVKNFKYTNQSPKTLGAEFTPLFLRPVGEKEVPLHQLDKANHLMVEFIRKYPVYFGEIPRTINDCIEEESSSEEEEEEEENEVSSSEEKDEVSSSEEEEEENEVSSSEEKEEEENKKKKSPPPPSVSQKEFERLKRKMEEMKKESDLKERLNQQLKISLAQFNNTQQKQKQKTMMMMIKTRIENYLETLDKEERLLLDVSLHFRDRFYVGINQKLDNIIFHDTGREKKFEDLNIRQNEILIDVFFETIVSDPQKDEDLKTFLNDIKQTFSSDWKTCILNLKKNLQQLSSFEHQFFKRLITKVSDFYGGINPTVDSRCTQKISALKQQKGNNLILLGELKGNGVCRHRSILFKLVCDVLGIRCRLLRGWFSNNQQNYGHCWNMVQVGGKFFLVDVMLSLSIIEEINSARYENLGGPKIEVEKEEKTLELIQKCYQNSRMLIKAGSFGSVFASKVDFISSFKSGSDFSTKKRLVAIKELNVTDLSSQTGVSFWKHCNREMMFMKFLNHPNIIKFIGSFKKTEVHPITNQEEEFLCIVMELLNRTGYTFKKELEKKEAFISFYHKIQELLIFLIEVCKGLRYMHSVGVIHFDLHPNNILVQWDQEKKVITKVVITDFGGAKEKEASFRTSLPAGAPAFTAPEIREMRLKNVRERKKVGDYKFTEKSDIYSFGKVMEIFKEFLEGFPEMMKLQQQCISVEENKRPSLNEMIYIFQNRLKYVNEKLKELFPKKEHEEEEEEEEEDDVVVVGDEAVVFGF